MWEPESVEWALTVDWALVSNTRRASRSSVLCARWSGVVPPRRRRAGYQPGELSEQLRDAITAEAARLDGLGDDLETIRATAQAFNALETPT